MDRECHGCSGHEPVSRSYSKLIVTIEQLIPFIRDPTQRQQVVAMLATHQPEIAQRIQDDPEGFIAEIENEKLLKYGLTAEDKEPIKRVAELAYP